MIAIRQRAKPVQRSIFTSTRTVALTVALASAAALTTAFPKLNFAWIAPFALAGLFWSWMASPARRALWIGFLSGMLYFSIMFSWFGVTASSLVGPYGFITVVGPAILAVWSFMLAAAFASIAYSRIPGALGPLAAAAAFAVLEWLRSVGVLGNPFAQIGTSQVDGPFAAFAAYGGSICVTFVVAAIGAFIASALLDRERIRDTIIALATIGLLTLAAYLAWPARHAAPARIPVVAIQGNIKQEIKWNQPLEIPIERYIGMTKAVAPMHPKLVLWPETVITTYLGDDDQFSYKDSRAIQRLRGVFGRLAENLGTTIIVGALERSQQGVYNALYAFAPNGMLDEIYRKRQLVPYAEWVPAKGLLGWFPYLDVLGKEVPAHDPEVVGAGPLAVAPLICWESAFSDVIHDQIARGANLLAVSTDDAWFGETAGPYQHAQIAQMRAIETGRWVLRAAATGISGIIAPDGSWKAKAPLDVQTTVAGTVGPPAATPFSRFGPWPVVYVLAAFALLALAIGLRTSPYRR